MRSSEICGLCPKRILERSLCRAQSEKEEEVDRADMCTISNGKSHAPVILLDVFVARNSSWGNGSEFLRLEVGTWRNRGCNGTCVSY